MVDASRFGRQIALPEVGVPGQAALGQARVLVVGMGGLGCPAALYLAATGVGHLTLVDDDAVAVSNLHRQILYCAADVGHLKVEVARERLGHLSPNVSIATVSERVSTDNVLGLVSDHDLVVDGTDNFFSRYLLSDACVVAKRPFVSAAVTRFAAQIGVLCQPGRACYRCLYPAWPPKGLIATCVSDGVMGTFAGVAGTLLAHEAVKVLLGWSQTKATVMHVDGLTGQVEHLELFGDPQCPACGQNSYLPRMDCSPVEAPKHKALAKGAPWYLDLPPCETMCAPGDLGGRSNTASRAAGAHLLTWDEALCVDLAGETKVFIDVRESWEPAPPEHIGSVVRMPLSFLQKSQCPARLFPAGKRLILFCHSGQRSGQALQLLLDSGAEDVWHIAGGLTACVAPVVQVKDTDRPRQAKGSDEAHV